MEPIPILQIRYAMLHESADIAAVLKEAFAAYESLYFPEAFAATTPTTEQIQNRMHRNEGPIWVALLLDKIVGTVSAVPKETGLYIRSMAVLPSARGAGAGRKILEAVERFALEGQLKRMYLSTTPFLTPAIKLYEHFGFSRNEEGPHDLYGTPLFTMEKPINQ